MPLLSYFTAVALLLVAHCGSWTTANRLGPFKVCPSCRDSLGAGRPPRDHNAAGSTLVLAQGEPCGVYTLSCASGLRCVPPPRDHSPLQALLQGRGLCAKYTRMVPTERPHPPGKMLYTHLHDRTHTCTHVHVAWACRAAAPDDTQICDQLQSEHQARSLHADFM